MPRNNSRRRNRCVTQSFTFEELGKSGLWVTADLEFEFEPGEPMVMYYKDGSGYPGSPPQANYVRCHVVEAGGEDWYYKRNERQDWFERLDAIIENHIQGKLEQVEVTALENFEEPEYESW